MFLIFSKFNWYHRSNTIGGFVPFLLRIVFFLSKILSPTWFYLLLHFLMRSLPLLASLFYHYLSFYLQLGMCYAEIYSSLMTLLMEIWQRRELFLLFRRNQIIWGDSGGISIQNATNSKPNSGLHHVYSSPEFPHCFAEHAREAMSTSL